MKRGALLGIFLCIFILLMCSIPKEPKTEVLIYEEITDEEIQTHIKETEQKKDIPVNGIIETTEAGQPSEELPQERVKVNEFTLDEATLLMRIAQAEGGTQGADGMWLIMSVVLNRVNSPDYPDNIHDVVYQPYQFSSLLDGNFDNTVVLKAEAHEALARIEQGDVAPMIIGFERKPSNTLEKYFDYAFSYKDHNFYVPKKGD